MTIKIKFSTIDGCRKTVTYKTLAGARKAAHARVGAHPEIGSTYAVSSDGVVTVTVSGCTLAELFPAPAPVTAIPANVIFYVVAGVSYDTFDAARAKQLQFSADGDSVAIETYNTSDAYDCDTIDDPACYTPVVFRYGPFPIDDEIPF